MDEKPIKMLTAGQVCEWLGISLDTLHKWFGMGLVGYRIGKVIRIPENELWKFLREHELGGVAKQSCGAKKESSYVG